MRGLEGERKKVRGEEEQKVRGLVVEKRGFFGGRLGRKTN